MSRDRARIAEGNVGPVVFAVLMAGFLASVRERHKQELASQSMKPEETPPTELPAEELAQK